MHHLVLMLLVVLAMPAVVGCKKAEPTAAPATPVTDTTAPPATWVEADPAKSLSDEIVAQLAVAKQHGKKPFAYLHADWCDPCVAIAKTRDTDPRMKAAFAPALVIGIDVDKVDSKQIEALGMKASVLPIFYRLDDSGRATADSIDGGAWGANLPENMAPPLAAFFAK